MGEKTFNSVDVSELVKSCLGVSFDGGTEIKSVVAFGLKRKLNKSLTGAPSLAFEGSVWREYISHCSTV